MQSIHSKRDAANWASKYTIMSFIICYISATIGSCESLSRASRPSLKSLVIGGPKLACPNSSAKPRPIDRRRITGSRSTTSSRRLGFRASRSIGGFDRTRMVSILQGFVAGEAIPPIDVLILPTLNDISGQPFKYRVLAGVHRFYASMAAGFELCRPPRAGFAHEPPRNNSAGDRGRRARCPEDAQRSGTSDGSAAIRVRHPDRVGCVA
jgi:hypothetical protein